MVTELSVISVYRNVPSRNGLRVVKFGVRQFGYVCVIKYTI